ncbi:hypothetical protein ABID14_000383 [Peptoniphilus olsenii]|uniref:Integrase n=1 Tax=Peptoniphilus olsenii TaxID=411570 RepID=A0ABV2J7N8_9FIRM
MTGNKKGLAPTKVSRPNKNYYYLNYNTKRG